MLYHILGLLDLLAAGVLIGGHYNLFHAALLYAALYLVGKLIFWRDVFSIIDAVTAVYLIFVFFGHSSALTWVFVAYFLYKTSVWLFGAMSH